MSLILKVIEGKISSGSGIYYKDEYGLIYKNKDSKSGSCFLLFDTLEVCFEKENKIFVSFDDYTNHMEWIKKERIEMPTTLKSGILKVESGFENEDRYCFNCSPRYEYSSDKTLKIDIMPSNEFFTIADNLIVGISNHQISSFIIKNLKTI